MYLHHVFIGDIARFNRITHAAAAHHREIGIAARHLRRQQQTSHIGLHKTHFAAIAFQVRVYATDFDLQLRFALILERRQQGEHLRIFGDLWRIEHALALAVVVSDLFLQVDRDQLIVHQLHFAVAEFEVGAAHIFAPLMGLDDPDTVLLVRRARAARNVIHLFFILRGHAYRVLRVAADDHRQRTCRQAARHLDVARRIRSVVAVVIMAHVGGGQNNVRFFILLQLLDNEFGLFRRFTELDIGKELGITNFSRIVGRQTDNRNIQPAAFEQRPRLKQTLAGAFLVNIGGEERELRPFFLLTQYAKGVIKLVIAYRHRIIANQVHPAKIGFRVL